MAGSSVSVSTRRAQYVSLQGQFEPIGAFCPRSEDATGVVNQSVDAGQALQQLLAQPANLVERVEVGEKGVTTGDVGDGSCPLGVTSRNGDPPAAAGQFDRSFASNPGARSGDDDNPLHPPSLS